MNIFEMAIATERGYSIVKIAEASIVKELIEMILKYGYKKTETELMEFYKDNPEAQEDMKKYLTRALRGEIWKKDEDRADRR